MDNVITKEIIDNGIRIMMNQSMGLKPLVAIHSRHWWEWERENLKQFKFTNEELDKAENHEDGLIAVKGIYHCFISKPLKEVRVSK